MAARVFSNFNWTPTLTADTTGMADSTYMALVGGASTQVISVTEVYVNGLAGSAAPMSLALARSSTIGVGLTALTSPASDGPLNPNATALASVVGSYVATGTSGPQRSSSAARARLNIGINAFGGSYRWNASPTNKYQIIGNAATAGEATLSALNNGTAGAVGASIIYEPE